MADSRIVWRSKPGQPCEVCDADSKNCSRTDDHMHLCRGDPADPGLWSVLGATANADYKLYRRADDRTNLRGERPDPPPQPPVDWVAKAAEYVPRLTPAWKARGCAALGLPAGSLACLPLAGLNGFTGPVPHLVLPECDGDGRVVGLVTRQPARDGGGTEKIAFSKAVRGLTLPAGWRERAGPVLVAEGASDTLAVWAARLCVVGRPFRDGGAGFLIRLLKDWPADRGIVVLADRDKDGKGRKKAEDVARAVAAGLARGVRVADPPGAAKDVRDWLTAPERGSASWPDRGRELLAHVEATAAEVRPGDTPPPSPPPPAAPGATPAVPRRLREVSVGTDQSRVNLEAAAALADDPDLFQLGDVLVTANLARAAERKADEVYRPEGLPALAMLHKDLVGHHLTRVARLVQPKTVGNGEVVDAPCHPPPWLTKAVYAMKSWPGVRAVSALVSHPVLLPDGRVLASPGYDPASGLLLAGSPAVVVPERPSLDDARRAVAELLELIADFPLAGPEYRSAWLAALLTPLAWWAFDGPAPLFLADGNAPGVGKGKLMHVIGAVLTGAGFPVTNYCHDPAETKKLITALAIAGDRLVLFDNLDGPFGNSALDMALTGERRWKERVLGASRNYDGPLHLTVYATGNNVQVRADLARRVCRLRMETAHERPEERADFRFPDLIGHVRANRPRLLAAALTVLRAWHVAGRPTRELARWGSFDGWSGVVRQAVAWCGLADPGLARLTQSEDGNPEAATLTAVLTGWRKLDPDGNGLTPGGMQKRLAQVGEDDELAEMKAALDEMCGGKMDTTKLGYRLRHYKGRVFGGFKLEKHSMTAGTVRWRVVRVASAPAGEQKATQVGMAGDIAIFPIGSNIAGADPTPHDPHHPHLTGAIPTIPTASDDAGHPHHPNLHALIPTIPTPDHDPHHPHLTGAIPTIPTGRRKLTVVEELGYTLVPQGGGK